MTIHYCTLASTRQRPLQQSGHAEGVAFLKLVGSLITDKSRARTARPDTIRRQVEEIAQARKALPGLQLVLGHGSGSFGHQEGKKHTVGKNRRRMHLEMEIN